MQKTLRSLLKKAVAVALSMSVVSGQEIAVQTVLQTIIQIGSHQEAYGSNKLGENTSSQYDPNRPLNNIKDNPIASIEVDNSTGGGETELDRTQNGTPVVQISRPSNAGVSVNYYKNFNVNEENLIINNSKGDTVGTKLGGVIYGNPNFNKEGGKQADIILNEVTSVNESKINGYLEIAGKQADLIIANPNGITAAGAGFINTARISLITGRSGMGDRGNTLDEQGNLNEFMLSPPEANAVIRIEGRNVKGKNGQDVAYSLGIDANDTSYTQLISRIVKINGYIVGGNNTNIEVISGGKKAVYNKDRKRFEVTKDNGKVERVKPEFGIDSTVFGGIQAGKIKIIATEDGVGVRIRSDVISNVEDIEFDINGNLILEKKANVNGKTGVNVKVKEKLSNGGKVKTDTEGAGIVIDAKGEVNNKGFIGTTGDIRIMTKDECKNQGTIKTEGKVKIDAKDITMEKIDGRENLISGRDVELKAVGEIDNKNGLLYARNAMTLTTETGAMTNADSAVIEADDIGITVKDKITNSGKILAQKNITLKTTAESADISNSGTILANKEIKLESGKGFNNFANGKIHSNNETVTLTAGGNIVNSGSTKMHAGKTMTLTTETGAMTNLGSAVIEADGIGITVKDKITNSGKILAQKNITLKTTADISNSGTILTNEKIKLESGKGFNNSGNGKIHSNKKTVTLTAGGNIVNADSATMHARKAMTLRTNGGNIVNSGSTKMHAGKTMTLTTETGAMTNADLAVIEADDIGITVRDGITNAGKIQSQKNIALKTTADISNSGKILANKEIKLESGKGFNNAMTLSTETGAMTNADLAVIEADDIGIIVKDGITNAGKIQSRKNITLKTTAESADISNSGTILANKEIKLESGKGFNNSGNGEICSNNETVTLTAGGDIVNADSAKMHAGKTMTLRTKTGAMTNAALAVIEADGIGIIVKDGITNAGKIQSQKNIALKTTADISNSGTILTNEKIKLESGKGFNNFANGKIHSNNETVTLTAGGNIVNSGSTKMHAGKTMTLTTKTGVMTNLGSAVIEADDIGITVKDKITNSGTILANEKIKLESGKGFNNFANGKIHSNKKTVTLTAGGDIVNADSAKMYAGETMTLTTETGAMTNADSAVIEADDIGITVKDKITNSGTILANEKIKLESGKGFNNFANGRIHSNKKTVTLTAGGNIVNADSATMYARKAMTLRTNGGNIVNSGSTKMHAGKTMTLTTETGAMTNLGSAVIEADGIGITVKDKITNSGKILAQKNITLKTTADISNSGTILTNEKIKLESGKGFNNSGNGKIHSNKKTVTLTAGGNIVNADSATMHARKAMTLRTNGGNIVNSGSTKMHAGKTMTLTTETGAMTNADLAVIEADDIGITVRDGITNAGKIQSQKNIALKTTADISNSGKILANKEIKLESGKGFNNAMTLSTETGAMTNADLAVIEADDIGIIVKDGITNAGKIQSRKNITLKTTAESADISNSGTILANKEIKLESGKGFNNSGNGEICSNNETVTLTAGGDIVNADSAKMHAGKTMTLRTKTGAMTNAALAVIEADGIGIIVKDGITNAGKIQSQKNIALKTTADISNSGTILTNEKIKLESGKGFNNFANGKIHSNNETVTLTAGGNIVNSGSTKMHAGKTMTLTTKTGVMTNLGSAVIEADDIGITVKDKITNSGTILANEKIKLESGKGFNNFANGKIHSNKKTVTLTAGGDIVNADSAKMYAGETMTLTTETGAMTNADSAVIEADDIGITVKDKITNSGTILANEKIKLESGKGFNNSGNGKIHSNNETVTLTAGGDIVNADSAKMYARNAMTLTTNGGDIVNAGSAKMHARNAMTLTTETGAMTNADLAVIEADSIGITVKNGITNAGKIQSQQNITLKTTAESADISNSGTILANKEIELESGKGFNNSGNGEICSNNETVTLTAGGNIVNADSAKMYARNAMTLSTKTGVMTNADLAVIEAGSLNVIVGKTITNNGNIHANNKIAINAGNSIINNNKNAMISGGSLEAVANVTIKNNGHMQALKRTDCKGLEEDNESGKLTLDSKSVIHGGHCVATVQVEVKTPQDILDKVAEIEKRYKGYNLSTPDSTTTSDLNSLYKLLLQVRDKESYDKVAEKIRELSVRKDIAKLDNAVSSRYNTDIFDKEMGGIIKVLDDKGNVIEEKIVDEELVQTMLKKLFGKKYKDLDWKLPNRSVEKIQLTTDDEGLIGKEVARYTAEKLKEEGSKVDGKEVSSDSQADSKTVDVEVASSLSSKAKEECEALKKRLISAKKEEINKGFIKEDVKKRREQIATEVAKEKERIEKYANKDWAKLSKDAVKYKKAVENLFTEGCTQNEEYKDYVLEIPKFKCATNSIILVPMEDIGSEEKHGIYNNGRFFADSKIDIKSMTLMRNDANALIYSKGDINFNIAEKLYNNAGEGGTGIEAVGAIKIEGYNDNDKLKQLENYNGRIIAGKDITITTNETTNYGSDIIASKEATEVVWKKTNKDLCSFPTLVEYEELTSLQKSHKSEIRSNNGAVSIDASSSITNYNSTIYGKTNLKLKTNDLVNSATEFEKVSEEHYKSSRELGFWGRAKRFFTTGHETVNEPNRYKVKILQSDGEAKLISGGTVDIKANHICNGICGGESGKKEERKVQNIANCANGIEGKTFSAYCPKKIEYESVIDGLQFFEVPTGKYGEYRLSTGQTVLIDSPQSSVFQSTAVSIDNPQSSVFQLTAVSIDSPQFSVSRSAAVSIDSPQSSVFQLTAVSIDSPQFSVSQPAAVSIDSPQFSVSQPIEKYSKTPKPVIERKYLYETDPLLADETTFLGSQYYLNRIGLDPRTIEQKFLGDKFIELDVMKKGLEKRGFIENLHFSPKDIECFINAAYETVDAGKVSEYGLEFGKELRADQINALKEDIVWYVSKTIRLPNGEKTDVLVPQIYLSQETVKQLKMPQEVTQVTQGILAKLMQRQAKEAAEKEASQLAKLAVQKETAGIEKRAQKEAQVRIDKKVEEYVSASSQEYKKLLEETKEEMIEHDTVSILNNFETNMELYAQKFNKDAEKKVKEKLTKQFEQERKNKYVEEIKKQQIQKVYKNVYDKSYALCYDKEYEAARKRNYAKANRNVLISGRDVAITARDGIGEVLNNAGTIEGQRTVVITTQQINNDTRTLGGPQAAITAGELVYIDATSLGAVNNNSGLISTTKKGSAISIKAGQVNNTTNKITDEYKAGKYTKTETTLGTTGQITSAGDLSINTTGDLNLTGSLVLGQENVNLEIGGKINSQAVQNHSTERTSTTNYGVFSNSTKQEETTKTRNLGSYIAGNNVTAKAESMLLQNTSISSQDNTTLIARDKIELTTALDQDLKCVKNDKGNWFTGTSTDINASKKVTNQKTRIYSGGNINLVAGSDITSLSGQFSTDKDINLLAGYEVGKEGEITKSARTGQLNLLTASDYDENYSLRQKEDGLLSKLNPTKINFDISKKGISASINHNKSKDEKTQTTTTAQVTNITSNGRVNLKSGNILILGSNVEAHEDIQVQADGNIILTEAQNTNTTSTSHDDTTVTVGVKVGNAYLDAASAATAVYDAQQALEKANGELKGIEKLKKEGKASKEAVAGARTNVAMAGVNLANATAQLASSIGGAATAASSSYGTGMYASAFANYDTKSQRGKSKNTWATQGRMAADGNVSFKSGNDMLQQGTNIFAKDTLTYDIERDLNIQASKDTYEQKDKNKHTNAGVSIGNNSTQADVAKDQSSQTSTSASYRHSTSTAKNIVMNVGRNAQITGADLKTVESLKVAVKNNLKVESLQDTQHTKGQSSQISIGVGISGSNKGSSSGNQTNTNKSGNLNVGFVIGRNNTDALWVNEQTSLTSENELDIIVGNKTTLEGSVINSRNNNLNINTKEIEYKDIQDTNETKSQRFGLSTQTSANITDNGLSNLRPKGQSTLTLKNTSNNKEQINKATIAKGNIVVEGKQENNLSNLNRNTQNTQELTKDKVTGALDTSVSLDNRVFTKEGRASIQKDFKDSKKNLNTLVKDITNNNIVAQVIKEASSSKTVITNKDGTKTLKVKKNDLSVIDLAKQYIELDKQSDKAKEKLNGVTNLTPKEVEKTLMEVAKIFNQNGQKLQDLKIANISQGKEGNLVGLSYVDASKTKQIVTININNVDLRDAKSIAEVIAHETTDTDKHHLNEGNAISRGNMAKAIMDMKNYDYNNTNDKTTKEWLKENKDSKELKTGSTNLGENILNAQNDQGLADPLKIVIQREEPIGDAVRGKLTTDQGFKCDTLENNAINKVNPLQKNKPYLIAAGEYDIIVDESDTFTKKEKEKARKEGKSAKEVEKVKVCLPHILKVTNRKGLRIHWGNWRTDSKGCILLGTRDGEKPDQIKNSRKEVETIIDLIVKDAEKDIKNTIEILAPKKNDEKSKDLDHGSGNNIYLKLNVFKNQN